MTLAETVALALAEDVGHGDITTQLTVPPEVRAEGSFVARQPGLLSGLYVVAECLRQVDASIRLEPLVSEGESFEAGAVLARVTGPAASLLTAERVSLNFLQRMCGIATLTAEFVSRTADTRAQIDPLMPYDADEPLAEKENARFWLTVHVPATAPPGTYRGSVSFTPSGSTTATVPVVFRVLPIKLQEDPSKIYGIYYYDPLDSWNNAKDEVSKAFYLHKSDAELDDLVAHGTRNVTTSLWSPAEKDGKFQFNFELLDMKIRRWRGHAFKGPIDRLVPGIDRNRIYHDQF